MARVVKSYDERYTEFLDVAQGLFFSKGYEKTSVQEIIRAVGVAKGTFYHYFDSKTDILEAIVTRMTEQAVETMRPKLEDDRLSAIEKLESIFTQANQWKLAQKDVMLETARLLYQDDNVLLREKMMEKTIEYTAPMVAKVLEQGVTEGVFHITHPIETAKLIYTLPQSYGKNMILVLLNENRTAEDIESLKRQIAVYNRSIERVLGMSDGSIRMFDADDLDAWF